MCPPPCLQVLKLDGWLQFMSDAHLVDSQFTLQDAGLAYLWSRMYTIDEIKDYTKYSCITFVDFLEALGRVADMKSLPSSSDLDLSGKGSRGGGEQRGGQGEEGGGLACWPKR